MGGDALITYVLFVFGLLVLFCWGSHLSIFCTWKSFQHTQRWTCWPHISEPPWVKLVPCKSLNLKKHHTWKLTSQPATYRHPPPQKERKKSTIVCNLLLFLTSWNKAFFQKKHFQGWLSCLLVLDGWWWTWWCQAKLKSALENRRMDKHSSNYIMIFSSGCLQNIVNRSSNDHHRVRCVSLVARLGLG